MRSGSGDGEGPPEGGPDTEAPPKDGGGEEAEVRGVRDRSLRPRLPDSDAKVREDEEFKVRLEIFILGIVSGFLFAFIVLLMRIFAAQEYLSETWFEERAEFDSYGTTNE